MLPASGSRRDEAEPEKQRNPAENREEFCGHARGRKMLPASGSRRDEAEPEKQRNPAENREEFCGHARGRKMLPVERFTEG